MGKYLIRLINVFTSATYKVSCPIRAHLSYIIENKITHVRLVINIEKESDGTKTIEIESCVGDGTDESVEPELELLKQFALTNNINKINVQDNAGNEENIIWTKDGGYRRRRRKTRRHRGRRRWHGRTKSNKSRRRRRI